MQSQQPNNDKRDQLLRGVSSIHCQNTGSPTKTAVMVGSFMWVDFERKSQGDTEFGAEGVIGV